MSATNSDGPAKGGAYRFSRHPPSVGWTLALTGVALIGSSALALVDVAVLVGVLAWLLPAEERTLALQHGGEYERYQRRTPRVLGRPR